MQWRAVHLLAVVALLAGCVAGPPPEPPTSLDLILDTGGSLEILGTANGTLVTTGAFTTSPLRGEVSGRIDFLELPYVHLGTDGSPPSPNGTASIPLGQYEAGRVEVHAITWSPSPDALVAIFPASASIPVDLANVTALRESDEARSRWKFRPDFRVDNRTLFDLDSGRFACLGAGQARLHAPFTVLMVGGTLVTDGASTVLEPKEAAEVPSLSPATARATTYRAAALSAVSGEVTLADACARIESASLEATGALRFTNARLRNANQTNEPSRSATVVTATGRFHLDGNWQGQGSEWRVRGLAASLFIDGQSGLPPESVVVAVVGIAAAWLVLKGLALALLNRASPAAHPARRAILAALQKRGGLTSRDLQRLTSLSRTATAFHTSLLARAGLVGAWRDGRTLRYQLGRGNATWAELPPLRRAILEAVRQASGPLSFSRIAYVLPAPRPGRTLLLYHLRRLAADGQITVDSSKRPRTYSARPQASHQIVPVSVEA